ncbi:MAG: phosphohistidine phosphatase SixA [Candidatus Margulisiibacteriota bacterium]
MKLYLLQHGDAEPKDVDPERPLSVKGIKDIENLAQFTGNIPFIDIYHSGKLRAMQTAEIIAQGQQVEEREQLAPNDPIDSIAFEIKQSDTDLMIVGHLPFLGKLASHLLTGNEENSPVRFEPGTLVCLEYDGYWTTRFILPPSLFY